MVNFSPLAFGARQAGKNNIKKPEGGELRGEPTVREDVDGQGWFQVPSPLGRYGFMLLGSA